MITKQILRSAVLAMGLYLFQSGYGQVSTPNNVPFNVGTDYVGWNGGTTVPLMVRHNGNQSIDFYTDSIQRMQLWHSPSAVSQASGKTGSWVSASSRCSSVPHRAHSVASTW